MKKITMCIAAALLAASCSKQKTETVSPTVQLMNGTVPIPAGSVTRTSYGFLKFKDLATYEAALSVISNLSDAQLDAWEMSLGYQSAYSYYNIAAVDLTLSEDSATGEEKRANIPGFKNSVVEDDLLLRIMDKNGMIQVGDYVFAASMDEGYILETNARNLGRQYTNLSTGVFVPSVMNKFNGDDAAYTAKYESVFELLDQTDTTGINPGNFSPVLFSTKDITKGQDEFYIVDNLGGKNYYRFKLQNVYQTAVMYYSLLNKNWVQAKNSLGIWTKEYDHAYMQYVNLSTDQVKYKKKGSSTWIDKSQIYPTDIYPPTKQKLRVYEGGKKLLEYKFETTSRWKIGATNPIWQPNERVAIYKS